MTSAAGAPPMPPLPRIMVLPTNVLTWAHQDILFFQPLLAVALGLVAWSTGPLGRTARPDRQPPAAALAQRPAAAGVRHADAADDGARHDRLRHDRGDARPNPPVQLRADWQRQLGIARATLDEELALYLQGASQRRPGRLGGTRGEGRADLPGAPLAGSAPWLSARPEDVVSVLSGYRPSLDEAEAAHQAYRDVGRPMPRGRAPCWSRRSRRSGRSSASSRRTWPATLARAT